MYNNNASVPSCAIFKASNVRDAKILSLVKFEQFCMTGHLVQNLPCWMAK